MQIYQADSLMIKYIVFVTDTSEFPRIPIYAIKTLTANTGNNFRKHEYIIIYLCYTYKKIRDFS